MNIVFFGCTSFSEKILKELIKIKHINIEAIFSIPSDFSISYNKEKVKNTNFKDLSIYSDQLEIPIYWVESKKGKKITNYSSTIKKINPDIILVMGWYYMVPKEIREIAKYGAWGIHASILPNYAGGAPLVWAIIEGQNSTGVTLFRLSNGVDDGDIISQEEFIIEENDTIREVYEKATVSSVNLLKEVFSKDLKEVTYKIQDKSKIKVYPQRSPEDGEINWNWSIKKIRDFIRAQTKPYPGAWTIINNKKIILWDASIYNNKN